MFDPNEINGLVQRLNVMMGGDARQKITFISERPQEGTSTIARKFAEGMAEEAQRKVLLIDAGTIDHERFITDGINPATGIAGSYLDGGKPSEAIHKVDYNLYLARLQGNNDMSHAASKAMYDPEFWETLQKDYPFIVIDAPALQSSSEGIALAVTADATVLVIEAERTRQLAIENLRSTLETAGAKVIGTVMSSHRIYVPEATYAY